MLFYFEVTIIQAETGSGKSTQIPQMILEDAIESGNGATTKIVVTQPRRISATALAERVADELGEVEVGFNMSNLYIHSSLHFIYYSSAKTVPSGLRSCWTKSYLDQRALFCTAQQELCCNGYRTNPFWTLSPTSSLTKSTRDLLSLILPWPLGRG